MIQIISFVKQESESFGQWSGGSSSMVYRYVHTQHHRYQYHKLRGERNCCCIRDMHYACDVVGILYVGDAC